MTKNKTKHYPFHKYFFGWVILLDNVTEERDGKADGFERIIVMIFGVRVVENQGKAL